MKLTALAMEPTKVAAVIELTPVMLSKASINTPVGWTLKAELARSVLTRALFWGNASAVETLPPPAGTIKVRFPDPSVPITDPGGPSAGGHFVFSCEAASEDEADLVLREKVNRYAHKASAVERQCREAGFDEVIVEHLPTLRTEGGTPVPGFLVTARKPQVAPAA